MAFSPIVWLAIGIIIMACEIIMPGFIVFWFGAGGILTALFIFIGLIPENSPEWQWTFFFVSSFILLGFWQLLLKKKFSSNVVDSSRDATLLNLRGKATTKIVPGIPGEVELYSMYHGIKKWKAESGETIEAGEEITVTDANGIKLIVKHI
ncbi:MAG TPA: NfeD family protein [Spirochaetota bacterium]|nr:NfeD family protein [Spirochaetota bacterium]HPI89366.1 NfeD family protein [Spirochaetota bacterium]HPR48289.1 NfeD family protein [Spirochaetota bacterium]